jgi:hypothetical protein
MIMDWHAGSSAGRLPPSISNTVIYAQITNTHRARVADELRDWK